eukprot:g2777.t1
MSNAAYDQLVKLIIIGDTAVGKTSLVIRYCDGGFDPKTYLSTVGVDFKTKVVDIDTEDLGRRKIKCQIWDTAGQERFKNITRAYYRGANGIIVVYDVTVRSSFDNVKTWLKDIEKYSGHRNQPVVLVGNKSDKKRDQVVDSSEGEALAKEMNVPFFEVSAKVRYNVDEAFLRITELGAKYKVESKNPDLDGLESEGQRAACC